MRILFGLLWSEWKELEQQVRPLDLEVERIAYPYVTCLPGSPRLCWQSAKITEQFPAQPPEQEPQSQRYPPTPHRNIQDERTIIMACLNPAPEIALTDRLIRDRQARISSWPGDPLYIHAGCIGAQSLNPTTFGNRYRWPAVWTINW
jgi:hypothetical protein